MPDERASTGGPAFVVLRQVEDDTVAARGRGAETPRAPGPQGAPAGGRSDATDGTAEPSERYAAVLRSEWRVALDL